MVLLGGVQRFFKSRLVEWIIVSIAIAGIIGVGVYVGIGLERQNPEPLSQKDMPKGVPHWVGGSVPYPHDWSRHLVWASSSSYAPFKTVILDHPVKSGEYFEIDSMGRVIPLERRGDGSFKPKIIWPEGWHEKPAKGAART